MKQSYDIMEARGNLKTDDDNYRFYVEPSDGGSVEFTGGTLDEAINYIRSVDGLVGELL